MNPQILDCIPVLSFGSCLVLSNALVTQLSSSDSPSCLSGGLRLTQELPDWAYKFRQIHFEGPNGEIAYADNLVDTSNPLSLNDSFTSLPGEYIYLGVFYNHFGHFMAECVHRLYIAKAFNKGAGSKFCVTLWPNSQEKLNTVQEQALSWMGIDHHDVMIVSENCVFERLLVPSQASALGFKDNNTSYVDFLTEVTTNNIGSDISSLQDTVFVSRSPFVSTGGTLGESFFDELFIDNNSTILRPERLSLKDQIHAYLSHNNVVFSEGSAVHGLELTGRINANGYMIGRGRLNASKTISKLGESRFLNWENDQSQKILPSLYALAGTNNENINKGPSLYSFYDTINGLVRNNILPNSMINKLMNSPRTNSLLKNAADADLGRYITEFHYDHHERIVKGEDPDSFFYRQLRELVKQYRMHWDDFGCT